MSASLDIRITFENSDDAQRALELINARGRGLQNPFDVLQFMHLTSGDGKTVSYGGGTGPSIFYDTIQEEAALLAKQLDISFEMIIGSEYDEEEPTFCFFGEKAEEFAAKHHFEQAKAHITMLHKLGLEWPGGGPYAQELYELITGTGAYKG